MVFTRIDTGIGGASAYLPTSTAALAALILVSGSPSAGAAQTPGPGVDPEAHSSAEVHGLVPDPPRGGSAIARAIRIHTSPVIDGVLDEAFWAMLEPITDFVQRDPVDGGFPSERTEVRIAYDEENLYFGFTLHDSNPREIRRSILQRGGQIGLDDHVVIGLDTYNDRRNGYIFEMNSFGTQDDAIYTDESIQIEDWNWDGVYRSEARITDEGWVLEVAIPFTTIRFPRAAVLDMGLLFYRSIPRKNETVFWPHLPQTYRGRYAQSSQYGTLVGLEGISPGRNLQLKPFLLAGSQKVGTDTPAHGVRDVGLDLKYSLTSSLTLDLTWNTDFAQVETDNVQVSLDRFSLFFPEKREFFLERAGLFDFGEPGNTQVFFSRRIGLEHPVIGGGRLTGQVGPFHVGLLNLQTGSDGLDGGEAGANNAVARVRADLGPRTSVGGLWTNLRNADVSSQSAGVDAQFRFLGSSSLDLWAARIWDAGVEEAAVSDPAGPAAGMGAGAATLLLRNATYSARLGYTNIGSDFLPALGFVRRRDQVRREGQLAFTPRFESSTWARQLTLQLTGREIGGQDGVQQSGYREVETRMTFQTGDAAGTTYSRTFERLVLPFQIRPKTVVPTGDYTFSTLSANASTNRSRRLSVNASASVGDFYNGTRSQVSGGGVFRVSPHLSFEAGLRHNKISLPVENGDFATNVLELNVKGAVNRSVFANALVQYDDVSERFQANFRLNWIHTPGSNLFLVLDTGYNTGDLLDPRDTRWERRTGVVKLTYLWAL